MNKKIIVTTISILIVIFIFIKFNKNIISDYILTKLSKWTELSVTSESVDIDFFKGKINLYGLEILNKSNFNDKNIFEVKKLTIEIEFSSLFSDLVKINKFILNEPKFFFEIKDMNEKQKKKETIIDNIGLVEKIIEQSPPKIYPPKKRDKNFIILNLNIKNSKAFIRYPNSNKILTVNLSDMLFKNTGNADNKQIKHSRHYKDVLRIIMGDIYFRIPDMELRKFLKEKYKIKY
jgi:uncharacterized protein involved in outer membrane biogenesis